MKVVVLMGGTSAERDVSLASGEAIYEGLRLAGIEAVKIDATFGVRQLPSKVPPSWSHDELERVDVAPRKLKELPADDQVGDQGDQAGDHELALDTLRTSEVLETDVVFLALHGGLGENGTVQALLDMMGVPYTGSGVLASAIAMDKQISKMIFQQVGIPTPPWLLAKDRDIEAIEEGIRCAFGFPCVVKPNDQGSTVGFSIVEREEELPDALARAAEYTTEILIEQYIPGRELTVAILEGKALPVIEIRPKHGVYDYECKYTKGMSEYIVPAQIPQAIETEIKAMALKAFNALKCQDYARVDFRLSQGSQLFCLEVNTLPGMTETSLVPKAARAVGIEFPELVARIADLAFRRC